MFLGMPSFQPRDKIYKRTERDEFKSASAEIDLEKESGISQARLNYLKTKTLSSSLLLLCRA